LETELNNSTAVSITQVGYYNHNFAFKFTCNTDKNFYIGDSDKRVCKFCGRTNKETKFSNRSHVIPIGLGNNRLFSNIECNECNQKYGEIIDNDLVKYLEIERAINRKIDLQIHKLKNPGKKSYIKRDKGIVIINSDWEKNPSIKVTEKDGKGYTTIQYPPFRPLNICKALARIALFCIPEKDLIKNQQIWKYFHGKIELPLSVLTYYVPRLNAAAAVHILTKSNMFSNEPSSMISLFYGNFILILPFSKEGEKYTKILNIEKPKIHENHLIIESDGVVKDRTITFVSNMTLIGKNIDKDKKKIDELIGSEIYDISD
jgi:hypothetical protein